MFKPTSRPHYLTSLALGLSLILSAAGTALAEGPVTASTTYGQGAGGKLAMAGSSALQPLVDQAAKNYQTANRNVQITVSAGGSGAGRSGVCQGSLDVGISDVPLTDREIANLDCGAAVQTAIAIQAFAVTANPKGPGGLQALTREQMQGIFTGRSRTGQRLAATISRSCWSNRLKGSGTRRNMANYLFNGDDTQFAVGASEEDNSQTVVNTVSQTPGAVFVSWAGLLEQPATRDRWHRAARR